MIIIYNIFIILTALLLFPIILIAFVVHPKFRAGFFQKLGFYSFKKNNNKTIVFHAVSVGETNAIKGLVKRYHELNSDVNIIITTTTKTGQEIAKTAFKDIAAKVTYYPYDFFFSVLSFLNTFKPEKVVIAETEIWPGFITLAKLFGIEVYIVNGRISPSSYKGYKKIKFFIAPVLNSYEKIFMQSTSDAQRIIDMGANQAKVEVMGNLKFDISSNLSQEGINVYSNELKTDKYRVFIAASTHKGEDEIAIKSYKSLKIKHQDAKLMIAPRHPERFNEVEELLKKEGLLYGKRSNKSNFDDVDVIILDTMGELLKIFSICYIAFIGGSFTTTGGHNPLEANLWGKPVISGPVVFNFKDVYKIVCEKKCAVIVQTPEELTAELISFYDNTLKYKTFCSNAKLVFEENQGATDFVLERI